MEKNSDFKPYISSDTITSEITVSSILTGIFLSVIFGGANAYLGLRVGMTVSASIPAAVIAMGVIRVLLKKESVLESNLVQTIGSAGESVAAGSIFTIPALFLWASEGIISKPTFLEISIIALVGGLLGVFFMIPLRNALIVKEHNILPYPEGEACAKVLLAGEKNKSSTSTVFSGIGISAICKFIIDGLKMVKGEISLRLSSFPGVFGTQIYPAVLSVGYICGIKISSYMLAGGIVSSMILIPLIVLFGGDTVIYPGKDTIENIYLSGGSEAIWSNYIRYIGAGALACGGIISLIKSLPLIVDTFSSSVRNLKITKRESSRTSSEIGIKTVIASILIITLIIWLSPTIPVPFSGALLIVLFGFFFATVSSRMVGLVGSSNNPVSGMSIATLLITSLFFKLTGRSDSFAMTSIIAIGSVICIVSAVAGDTSQDLKTGYILGATPKKQQLGEILGVTASALAIGATMNLLDNAWGFGSKELAAPQATLMKIIVEGVISGQLPWILVFTGVFLSVIAEILKIPSLPFAIGIYLPSSLSACIAIGAVIRYMLERFSKAKKEDTITKGTLFCSGMIAGEGIVGIILAILAIFGIDSVIDISSLIPSSLISEILTAILLLIIIMSVVIFSLKGNKSHEKKKLS